MDSHDTPLPIYKRSKNDDEQFKESLLKPHEYLSSKTHPVPNVAVPDLKLFENMEVVGKCKGFSSAKIEDDDEIESEEQSLILCPALKRLVAVLNYYNSLMLNAVNGDDALWQNQFIEFCDKYYGQKWMMEDHMHFVAKHSDLKSTQKMAVFLDCKCFGDLAKCGGTARHYRNRGRVGTKAVHFYVDYMDSLHFNVLHLVDVGLRVNTDDNLEHNQNRDGLKDLALFKMSREIQSKRERCFFERLDGTSKFSLCSTVESNHCAKGGMTKLDSVLKDFRKEVGDDAAVHRFVEFIREQRYDTETMNEDMTVYAESNQCNIKRALLGGTVSATSTFEDAIVALAIKADIGLLWNQATSLFDSYLLPNEEDPVFDALRQWLRYHRVSGSSFSTGKWWAYWPWYRQQTIDSLLSKSRWEEIDFGGHSMKSLCVFPHFANLKEEALGSGFISTTFWSMLFKKATIYLQTACCRNMVDHRNEGYYMQFDVSRGFKVKVEHLMALLLYTDSSEYCTALSLTFRAIESGETIGEMNKRNSMYYWTSRYLRELVMCFGIQAYKEQKAFFTGISYEIPIPQFQIGLIGPTSTTMAKEVAVRFAGENGMIVFLKGGGSHYFDASIFSAYPEEQERIFCGSISREAVTSIALIKSARNYRAAIGAYSKFDAIFSAQKVDEMTSLEMDIIKESIRWINGGDDAVKHSKLDLYILETFYSFVVHKKMVLLDLSILRGVKHFEIVNMVMNPLWNQLYDGGDNEPTNANLMKPFVFTVFRDVCQVKLDAVDYRFDLMSFLRMIESVNLPKTLELIIIEGGWWSNKEFNEMVKQAYADVGIRGVIERLRRSTSLKLKL